MQYGDKTVSSYLSICDLTVPPFYATGSSISLTLHSVPVIKPPPPPVELVPITNEQVKPKVEDLSSFLNAMPEASK
jgi:hypothetical protein